MSGTKFVFSNNFEKKIDLLCKAYDKLYSTLDGLKNEKFANYGLCGVDYGFRIIRPSDVATYIDYFFKMLKNNQFEFGSPTDVNVFSVSFIKKTLKENGSDSIEKAQKDATGLSWINPKKTTLDDIRIMLENECFQRAIYSNWEMAKRVRTEQFESDLKMISDMNFTSTVKKIVDGIPSIVESDEWFKQIGNINLVDMIRVNIESMIEFAFTMNICTLMSMKKYAVPVSSYDIPGSSHRIDNFNETVDVTKCGPVFIVLTEGKTPLLSSGIRSVTHSNFTHVSIGFDPDLSMMYSFGGPYQGDNFSNDEFGCRLEAIGDTFLSDKYVKVFVCYMSLENLWKIQEECQNFINNQQKTVFDWRVFRNFILGIDKLPEGKDKYHQVCSTFVNMLFKNVGVNLFSDINMPSPKDYNDLATSDENKDKFVQIYYGKAGQYSEKYFSLANKFAMKKASKQFDEVVTECCLLKTNKFTYSNKLPYNCNFRDIVDCDMHPQFKDTKSALIYILTNVDSPISMLINEYADTDAIDALKSGDCGHSDSFVRMIMRVCPVDTSFVDHHEFKKYINADIEDDYYKKYHNVGFHTDVNWLDKIAYGNNFLDGNYRKDAMGNNNTIPIANTLDMIWKMYYVDSCDNKTLANNICKVGGLMLNLIGLYSQGRLMNWEFVRDVLSVLGEILTRSMLQLYANNTRIIAVSDSMEDTNDPGYMYTESFYVEADAPAPTNNAQQGNDKIQGATIQNGTKNQTMVNATAMAKAVATRFVDWVKKTIVKTAELFKNHHLVEINNVTSKAGMELNAKISNAIGQGQFGPTLNNVRKFNLNEGNVAKLFSNLRTKLDTKPENGTYDAVTIIKGGYNVAGATIDDKTWADDNARKNALVNWAMYGTAVAPKPETATLNGDLWNSIVKNITEFTNKNDTITKQFASDLANVGEAVKSSSGNQPQNGNAADNTLNVKNTVLTKTAMDEKAIQDALAKQYFKYHIETYNAIVAEFNANPNMNGTANQTDATKSGDEQKSFNPNSETTATQTPANPPAQNNPNPAQNGQG